MASRAAQLRAIARRLEQLDLKDPADREPNRFPRDPDKTTDENVSMDPNHFPGILTETLGGPKRKRHRSHQYEGPRGVAEAEEDEDDEES
jgi:hypothetical protein